MKLSLNPDVLTLGDLADFEDASGQSLTRIVEAASQGGGAVLSGLPMKTLLALVWVCGRKDDPDLTLEKVRATPLADLDDVEVEVAKTGDPTPASV